MPPVFDAGASADVATDDANEVLPDYEESDDGADTMEGLRTRIAQLESEKKLILQVCCSRCLYPVAQD